MQTGLALQSAATWLFVSRGTGLRVCTSAVVISTSVTSTSSHLDVKVLRGVDSPVIFFFFFASFCSKFFQEAFNHAGPFPRMSVSILITRGLGGWTGGEAYCFCIVSTISSVWTCVCSQISARVSGDSVLSCLLTSTTDTARRMTDPVSCVAVESPRPGGGGLEKTNGVPKSAVTNAFQRLADRLANQYNSNGCFCLLYK